MIQRIAPQLVHDISTLQTVPVSFGFEPAYRGWTTRDRTRPGHMGSPQFASPEKGEHLFAEFTRGAEAFLREVACWDGRSFLQDDT